MLLQCGKTLPRNHRNPNDFTFKDLHQQWCQHCEAQAQVAQGGNRTHFFQKKTSGTYQENKDTFFKTKSVTGAIAKTGISHEEGEIMVDSGPSMHMMSKSRFVHEETETIRKSEESCTIITAHGTSTSTEGAVHVRNLDMLIAVQLLED